jgi:hypothetical protein
MNVGDAEIVGKSASDTIDAHLGAAGGAIVRTCYSNG